MAVQVCTSYDYTIMPDLHITLLKTGELLPAAFQKSSVQTQEVYQPIGGGGELNIAIFKRVLKIQTALG
jgi:hypothetical protein